MRTDELGPAVFRRLYNGDIDGVVFWSDNFATTYFPKEALLNGGLLKTKDRLFLNYFVLYLKNKSVLIRVFDEKLQSMAESGLIGKLFSVYMTDYQMPLKQRSQSKFFYIGNIFGALQILAVSNLFCLIVFILELISVKCPRVKCILDYFTY